MGSKMTVGFLRITPGIGEERYWSSIEFPDDGVVVRLGDNEKAEELWPEWKEPLQRVSSSYVRDRLLGSDAWVTGSSHEDAERGHLKLRLSNGKRLSVYIMPGSKMDADQLIGWVQENLNLPGM